MPFNQMKTFLFQKIVFLFHIFISFPILKKSLSFRQKTLTIRVKKTCLRTNIVRYALYSKFATFNEIRSCFFPKKSSIFQRNKIWYVMRNLTISVAFYGKFVVIFPQFQNLGLLTIGPGQLESKRKKRTL